MTGMLLQLLVYIYTCEGGDPPLDKFQRKSSVPGFGVKLFPNSFGLIPELVYFSSELAWLIPDFISPF